jgi:hypothetical protein
MEQAPTMPPDGSGVQAQDQHPYPEEEQSGLRRVSPQRPQDPGSGPAR